MTIALIIIGLIITYALIGFATGTINHMLFRPDNVDRKPLFIICLLFWPVILIADGVTFIYRRVTRTMSLDEYLVKVDRWVTKRQQRIRGKDINA